MLSPGYPYGYKSSRRPQPGDAKPDRLPLRRHMVNDSRKIIGNLGLYRTVCGLYTVRIEIFIHSVPVLHSIENRESTPLTFSFFFFVIIIFTICTLRPRQDSRDTQTGKKFPWRSYVRSTLFRVYLSRAVKSTL